MCSIVGYVGNNKSKAFVLEGLLRLEYRGYDSAGFACFTQEDNLIRYAKAVGGLHNLIEKIDQESFDGGLGIGHSRWATHGKPSEFNAHPQFDCYQHIALVHNGIVENHLSLKKSLEDEGHVFRSDTDTEVIAHLFESLLAVYRAQQSHEQEALRLAVITLVSQLEGPCTCIALLREYPDAVVVVRRRSPLCIGIGNNEMFVASDAVAFAGRADKIIFMPDESFAFVTKNDVQLYDFQGKSLSWQSEAFDMQWSDTEKNHFEHYMLKEIYEQKPAISKTVNFLDAITVTINDYLGLKADDIRALQQISFVACGTSWHAARIAQFFFEHVCKMPISVYLASEFRYMPFFPQRHKLYVAISQSGETADTLEALRVINGYEMPTVALTNVASSTIVRETGGFLLTQAGREVSVASTKAFSTQLAALYWLAHRIALEKEIITTVEMAQASADLSHVAMVLEQVIEQYKHDIVERYAKTYARYTKAIFLGRNSSYPFAMEAALKLKEVAYVFSQCYPAGELKHGPLALIDGDTPVFIFSHLDPVIYQKLVSNAQEVKARGGHIVAFVFEGQSELALLADLCFTIPKVPVLLGPLAMTGLMQFFVYAIAKELERPIDKPRNLAKSVTVE